MGIIRGGKAEILKQKKTLPPKTTFRKKQQNGVSVQISGAMLDRGQIFKFSKYILFSNAFGLRRFWSSHMLPRSLSSLRYKLHKKNAWFNFRDRERERDRERHRGKVNVLAKARIFLFFIFIKPNQPVSRSFSAALFLSPSAPLLPGRSGSKNSLSATQIHSP